jgi:hypothetical protein
VQRHGSGEACHRRQAARDQGDGRDPRQAVAPEDLPEHDGEQHGEQVRDELLGDQQIPDDLVDAGRHQDRERHVARAAVVVTVEERRVEEAPSGRLRQRHEDAGVEVQVSALVGVVHVGGLERRHRAEDDRSERGQREPPGARQQHPEPAFGGHAP